MHVTNAKAPQLRLHPGCAPPVQDRHLHSPPVSTGETLQCNPLPHNPPRQTLPTAFHSAIITPTATAAAAPAAKMPALSAPGAAPELVSLLMMLATAPPMLW